MFSKPSFQGGIYVPALKEKTSEAGIEVLPPPEKIILPLLMHSGSAAKILVKHGEKLKMGQMVAEAVNTMSAAVHSPVSGEVNTVGLFPHPNGQNVMAIEITNDSHDDPVKWEPLTTQWREAAPGEIIQKIISSGIVGMGGMGIPTHTKLTIPPEKKIETLIINGAESEPYLSADHRLMLEMSEELLLGALIAKKIVDAKRILIGIEDNKPNACDLLSKKIVKNKYKDISVIKLSSKYPQGCEKQMVAALLRDEIPMNGDASDIGCIVLNVATTYALWDAVSNGKPLYQRVITVAGPGVEKSANLLVRIGTPIKHILEYCGFNPKATLKVTLGGPMSTPCISLLDAPVIKTTRGILALNQIHEPIQRFQCIQCSKCIHVCPIRLLPNQIVQYASKQNFNEAESLYASQCIECGCCSYICPSKINLLHFITLTKRKIASAKIQETPSKKSK